MLCYLVYLVGDEMGRRQNERMHGSYVNGREQRT